MPAIRLTDLPAPPAGKTGWPWTEESPAPAGAFDAARRWPRISVVTPSLNQAEFLEQTIRSVLLQGYPNLEYVVIDGGSTDGSLAVIEKYASHLTHWESRPDRGQGHAINKGFRLSTGEILCWLNSDDFYLPGTLQAVAESLAGGTDAHAVVGHSMAVYADGSPPRRSVGRFEGLERLLQFWKGYYMHQPSIFWRREVFEKVGYLDESQYYIIDFDYWVRIARHFEFKNIDRVLSCATRHAAAKTSDDYAAYLRDLKRMAPLYWGPRSRPAYWRLKASLLKHECTPYATYCYWAASRRFKSLSQRLRPRPEVY